MAAQSENGSFAPVVGLVLDKSGNLVASDGARIVLYAPSGAAWPQSPPPTRLVELGRAPSALALNAANNELWAVDAPGQLVAAYSYPSGTIVNEYLNLGSPTAVAVVPGETPPSRSPQPSAPTPAPTPGSTTAFISTQYEGATPQVDVANIATGTVDRAITNGICAPGDSAVDPQGNLYVPNGPRFGSSCDDVAVFAPMQAGPSNLYAESNRPTSVAVGADRTLAVAGGSVASGSSEVVVYPQGNSSLATALAVSGVDSLGLLGVAIDANDDVFTEFINQQAVNELVEFPRTRSGYGSEIVLPTQLFSTLAVFESSAPLAIDVAGNIVAPIFCCVSFGSQGIGVFPAGAAKAQYVIGSRFLDCENGQCYFALDATGEYLYVLESTTLLTYRYPLGTPVAEVTVSELPAGAIPNGLSVAPAATITGSAVRKHALPLPR